MNAINGELARAAGHGAIEREVWLLGQSPLRRFLDYVRDRAIGGRDMSETLLIDQWRAANDIFFQLEKSEGGIADKIGIADLPASLQPLVAPVRESSRFKRAFDNIPWRFAMVELDKLVLTQLHVNVNHGENLKARLGPTPSPEELFHFALPMGEEAAPVHMRRTGGHRYMFWSESSDLRLQEVAHLSPEQIGDYDAFGPIGAVLGLMIGFGSNFLTAIQCNNRVLLHNGHHRAYALRDLGITHAPCLIQVTSRLDELALVGPREVADGHNFFCKAPRPPILRDLFDPRLRAEFNIHKVVRTIQLSIDVRESETHDFASATSS